MATRIVGLDLGTRYVKASELVTTFRSYELTGFGTEGVELELAGRPSIEAIAMAARRLLERRGLLDETIMCTLPADYVSTVAMDFPFEQPKKIAQVLPFQLEDALPFDTDDAVYDYQVIRRNPDGGVTVLVAYVMREVFSEFLDSLKTVGIDPKVVSVGALAYYNLYDALIGEDVTDAVAILDIGHVHSELTIFDDGEPVVVRNIIGGGHDATVALADAFNVGADQAERGKLTEGLISLDEEAAQSGDGSISGQDRRALISRACRGALTPVIREVKRSLVAHYELTGDRVQQIYLTGGTSMLRGVVAWLEQRLGVPVAVLDPLDVPFNRLAEEGDRLRPYAGKALAVSMRAFHRAHQSQINFRKGEFVYTGDFGYMRGRVYTLAMSMVLMIVLAAGVAVSKKRVLEAQRRTMVSQVRAVAMEVLGQETDDVDAVFRAITAAGEADFRKVPKLSAFQVLFEISNRLDTDLKVDVNRLELDLDRKKLELTGKTESGGDVERIVESLESYNCFKNKVSTDKVDRTMDEKTKFRLSATNGCT